MNWNNCYTTKRFGKERSSDDARSAFQRDYDRIIFSSPFRRLQNKTQIFPLPEYKLVHNRLTHSLEVVSVGRSLAALIGSKLAELPDLHNDEKSRDFYTNHLSTIIAAACLAHDLGNPSFGHSGEDAISAYFINQANNPIFKGQFTEQEWADLSTFEGNANAFRMLTRSYPHRAKGGFQMTYPVLASILKYPCEALAKDKTKGKHRSKYGYFKSDEAAFNSFLNYLPLKVDSENPRSHFRHPFVYITEAADDISYLIVDYEDAHRLGILPYAQYKEDLLRLLSELEPLNIDRYHREVIHYENDRNEAAAYLRAKCINSLVQNCARIFIENEKALIEGQFTGALLDHMDVASEALAQIRNISVEKIYQAESVLKIELAGFEIIGGLMQEITDALLASTETRTQAQRKIITLMPQQFRPNEDLSSYEKCMLGIDYVSGMTDNYALELYRNIRGISLPAI